MRLWEITEAGLIKPQPPLSAEELQKESERRARIQQQTKDEGQRHARRLKQLRDKQARR